METDVSRRDRDARSSFDRLFLASMAAIVIFAAGGAMRSRIDADAAARTAGFQLYPPTTAAELADYLEIRGASNGLSPAEHSATIERLRRAGNRPLLEALDDGNELKQSR